VDTGQRDSLGGGSDSRRKTKRKVQVLDGDSGNWAEKKHSNGGKRTQPHL
jgi:hypothetical protein